MKQRRLIAAGALFVAGAMALSACSSSSSGGSDSGGGSSSDSNAQITIYNVKPQNPLVPGNTNEVGGGNILDNVFRGLVQYNPDTAAPEMSMAESIKSTDNFKTWDIKLKAGQTFQDGTPVDADSFINSWNWTAYGPNAALNNYFFASFDGYADLNPADPDEDGPKKAPTPTTKTLSGLKKVSDTEFTATLSTAQSFFPTMIGYTAFYPLPKAFFDDSAAFGKKPIGNGPFQITAGDGDTGFTLTKWSGYKGPDVPKIGSAIFKTYTSDSAGYSDVLAGNLDFMDQVPASALVDNQYQSDRPDHFVNKAVGIIQTATLPQYDKNFKDDPNIGKALSLAIDRDTITKSVFNGGRTPATGWVSPIVDGYKAGACGEFCTYNPTEAKSYLAKSKFKGPFSYSYNSDGPGNKEAAEAICNSIKNALGVVCNAKPYVDFATLRADVTSNKMDNMFRTGWQMDYPSIENFLEPLYATGAGSNDGRWSNPDFDALIKKANSEEGDASYADYQAAEKLISTDMAIIPLWYQAQQSVWSDRLANVKVTPRSTLDLADVTVKS